MTFSPLRIRIGTLALLAGVTIFIWYLALQATSSQLTVAFLDIGQGDAIYIEGPNGNQILIDGGADTKVLARLGEVMPLGDRSIDVVIGTHPDKDHIGGLPDVLKRYYVSYVFEPGMANDTAAWDAFLQAIADEHAGHIIARRGMEIDLGQGVMLSILFPDKQIAGKETNAASIVAKLSYGAVGVMLTGDAPQSVEDHLVTLDGGNLKSDILKAGHHGSKTSSAPQFLDAVRPAYGIISAGKGNPYGHPHKEVVSALTERNVRTLSTIDRGTIIFTSDGTAVALQE